MNNAPKIAEQYLAAWNERDPAARRASTDARFSSVTGFLDNAA